MEMGWISQYRD